MAFRPPRFYPILDWSRLQARPLEHYLEPLRAAGVGWLQVRCKELSSREFVEAVRQVQGGLPEGCRLIVNDRADVALLTDAAGVHVGQTDLPPSEVRKVLGPDALVGLSTHTLEQVEQADAEPVDYIAFGPIFETQSKAQADPVVGLEGLRRARELTRKPLVAIGGISVQTGLQVIENGANSIAVIDAWMAAEEIGEALASLRKTLGRLD